MKFQQMSLVDQLVLSIEVSGAGRNVDFGRIQ